MKKSTFRKVSAKSISYNDLRRKEIELLETDIYGFVIRPEKYSVFADLASSEAVVDPSVREESPVLTSSIDALHSFARLAELAREGDKHAIGALANQALTIIHFLNELADRKGKGSVAIKKIAAETRVWPQLLGIHPDELKESSKRVSRIGLGIKLSQKTSFSDLPTQDQLWRAIIGGYIRRISYSIRRVRSQWRIFELDAQKGLKLPAWIDEALRLPQKESAWCSFALKSLKLMNGGKYPDDFIARGESNAQFYNRKINTKIGVTPKNQAIVAAEKAFRKAWKARF
jgi:hypothetical protein